MGNIQASVPLAFVAGLSVVVSAPAEAAPMYVLVFTHTEDHVNHALSEERYERLLPEVERVAAAYPATELTWTVMFQGADAASVSARDPDTGVASMLRAAADAGVVRFGYHGQHDPTYDVRPTLGLTSSASWTQIASAVDRWVTCAKDPLLGGCVAATGGGIDAVLGAFGAVDVVSGITLGPASPFESGAGAHAVARQLPDRAVGFGWSGHAPYAVPAVASTVAALVERLAPAVDTPPTAFWMDDVLLLHDVDPRTGEGFDAALREGPPAVEAALEAVDRSHVQVVLAHLGDKYVYTRDGTSPTDWAYDHPMAPELPPWLQRSRDEIEAAYANSADGLEALAARLEAERDGSRFVDADTLLALAAPPAYRKVDAAELDALARDLLARWRGRPPDWVTDGAEYYSLRDAFVLLALAIADGMPASVELERAHGPFADVAATSGVRVEARDVRSVAANVAAAVRTGGPWAVRPPSLLPASYTTSRSALSTAQALYGLAAYYTSAYAGAPPRRVSVPATAAMPVTRDLLVDLGCVSCNDAAWSLKPARLR